MADEGLQFSRHHPSPASFKLTLAVVVVAVGLTVLFVILLLVRQR